MTRQHIDPASLVDRRIYRVISRNLVIGAWNAEKNGFIGIREKFGDEYLFTEYEHDSDPHFGTARAMEDMGVDVPPEVAMHEHGPKDPEGYLTLNQPLFDLLKEHEERAYELREAEADREQAEYEAKRAAMTPEEKHLERRQGTSQIVDTRNRRRPQRPGALAWGMASILNMHRFEVGQYDKKGSKPDDPGWWGCSCGTWEGYWSGFNRHVAEDQIEMLIDAGVLPRPEAQEAPREDQAH